MERNKMPEWKDGFKISGVIVGVVILGITWYAISGWFGLLDGGPVTAIWYLVSIFIYLSIFLAYTLPKKDEHYEL